MKWGERELVLSGPCQVRQRTSHVDDNCFKDTKMCNSKGRARHVRVVKCDHAATLHICGCAVQSEWNIFDLQ